MIIYVIFYSNGPNTGIRRLTKVEDKKLTPFILFKDVERKPLLWFLFYKTKVVGVY